MRANSLDLRRRIVNAVRAGHPKTEVADLFGVDCRTINRYLRLDATGELAPKPIRGRPPRIPPERERDLALQLRQHPAATLAEHCRRWATLCGVNLSPATMSRAIRRIGWTRKKERWQPASGTNPRGLPGGPRR